MKRFIYRLICVFMGLIFLTSALLCVKVQAAKADTAKTDAAKTDAAKDEELAFLFEKGVQILFPRKGSLPIRFTLEYSEIKSSCFLSVSYSGEPFDIMDSDNELSLKIIKNATEDLNYHFDEGKPQGNVVEAAIRYE